MSTIAEKLVRACIEAAKKGADFPSVWHTVLKPDPSVMGPPVQRLEGTTARLEVSLISGQRILVGPGRTDYAIG